MCNAELCVSSPYYLRVHLGLLRLLSFKETPTEEADGNGHGAIDCRAGGSPEAAAQSKR